MLSIISIKSSVSNNCLKRYKIVGNINALNQYPDGNLYHLHNRGMNISFVPPALHRFRQKILKINVKIIIFA